MSSAPPSAGTGPSPPPPPKQLPVFGVVSQTKPIEPTGPKYRNRSSIDHHVPRSPSTLSATASSSSSSSTSFVPRFDHICIAVSDVSEMSEFITQTGGRACEGFLTPVYLSATWEFSNTAELQVIAPVESFSQRRNLTQAESSTTTKAFFEGNHSLQDQDHISSGSSSNNSGTAAPTNTISANASSSSSSASPASSAPYSSPNSRPRSTFLQRYLKRHGPSVHHVAFLVPNLQAAKERFQSFGYTVYGWSDNDPLWKEFFLTPKQSLGVVIQVAESGSITPDLNWTTSSAMLSQTHLTPVVKKHIAKIHEGVERWSDQQEPMPLPAAATPPQAAASQIRANATAAAASPSSSASSSSSAFISTSTSIDSIPILPTSLLPSPSNRLALLGLRLRCSSESAARRQWSDMLQAHSCLETINARTGVKTLTFRWPQAPMYIAVDIEQPEEEWKKKYYQHESEVVSVASKAPKSPSSSAAATSPSSTAAAKRVRHRALDDKDARQWDGPKWIEMSTSDSTSSSSTASTPSPSAAAVTTSSTSSSSSSILSFTPTFGRLPLDSRIMRSAFVCTSQAQPLPRHDHSHPKYELVPVKTELKAKL